MGQKYLQWVLIWDEAMMVPHSILQTLLDQKGIQAICCGDQGQLPLIAGESLHDWLHRHAAYYEEITINYRAKYKWLKALTRTIRLQPDKVQCQEM